jgi:glutathione S-transferase
MLKLYGFPLSNYYNRVKLVLLEKGLPFEEVLARPQGDDRLVKLHSPARRVPFLEVSEGEFLSESLAIMEYLDETYPATPLLPEDPLARARVRELILTMDVNLEWVARRLYAACFAGGTLSEETRGEVEKDLRRGVHALQQLVKFDPYIAGNQYTLAACTAFVHLKLISIASKMNYGSDALEALAPKIYPYLKMLGERAAVARVNADRKAALAASAATPAAKA